jgi:hypothetical protein
MGAKLGRDTAMTAVRGQYVACERLGGNVLFGEAKVRMAVTSETTTNWARMA